MSVTLLVSQLLMSSLNWCCLAKRYFISVTAEVSHCEMWPNVYKHSSFRFSEAHIITASLIDSLVNFFSGLLKYATLVDITFNSEGFITFQVSNDCTKPYVQANIPDMLGTIATFQRSSGWLNESALANVPDISATLATFQRPNGWLKYHV